MSIDTYTPQHAAAWMHGGVPAIFTPDISLRMSTDRSFSAALFGFAGVAANLGWPLMRNRSALLSWQVVACLLMLVHFALLSARTGALIMFVAGVQAALAIPLGRSPRFKFIYLGLLLLTLVVCCGSWQGPQSVYSSLALVLVCNASFQLNQLHRRAFLMTAIFAWVAHNFMAGSIPGLISNTLAFCVSAYILFRVCRQDFERGARGVAAPA